MRGATQTPAFDLELAGAELRTLGPADALLFACATGATWTWPLPTVQWSVDVLAFLPEGLADLPRRFRAARRRFVG